MTLKIRIRKHERGLRFRYGDFKRLLEPGTYWLWSRLWSPKRDTVDVVSTLVTKLEHPMFEAVLNANDPALGAQLEVINLSDTQRALIWRDGRLFAIVGPGRHAFWKTPYKLDIEVFDVETLRFTHAKLETIVRHPESGQHFDVIEIDPHAEALVIVNGELNGRLTAGKYVFWKNARRVRVVPIDRREQTADVAGQEIMTSDKVTLRVNLLVTYQVSDAVKAVTTVSDYAQSLYREAQLVLRAAVGAKAIDALLTDKESIGSEVLKALADRAAEFGLTVRSVGLRDI
ncbi:MAG: slipin family protein, partial [Phycisphaerales bacterium]|nr:slipin family protein [Phycisphaerales bacterium]